VLKDIVVVRRDNEWVRGVSLLPQDGEQRGQKTVKRRRRIVRVKDLMESLVEWSSATQDGDVLCDAQQVVHVHERVLYLMRLMTMRAFDILLLVCQEPRLSRKVGGQFPAAWKIFAKFEDLPGRAATKVRARAKERHHLVVDECGDHRCKMLVELVMSRTLVHK
jgi:hypothetical protein